jgi:basic amino acid/polyamine antiporter, APA family
MSAQPQPVPGPPQGPRPVEGGPTGPQSTQSLFVRNATGLVRDLTPWDAFNLVFAAVLVPIGFMEVMSFAPQFWPHANLLVSFLIAAPLVACFGAVYLYFTELMPRSGGDYVWVSRTLHPSLGFIVNAGLTYVFLTWVALNFALIVTVLMPSLAYVAGIKAGWVASPGHLEQALIATVLTVLYALLMIRGIRPVARFMSISFVVVWIGVVVMAIVMAVGTHAGFIHTWNTTSGTGLTYTGVIAKAGSLGFSVIGPLSLAATLYAMVYAFNVYTGFQWTGYFAGEIKNVRRSAVTSIIGGLVAAVIGYTVLAALVYKFFGYKFFGSLVYLGFGPGSAHVSLPFSPYLPSLVKFFPVAQWVQVALVAMFILTIIWWTPAGFLLGTRNAFAWSFDRLAPERLTDVSDRFHTPVVATIFVAVVIEVLNLLNVYSNLAAWLLSVIWILGFGFVIVSIAAGLLPWMHRDLFERGPGWAKHRFILPVITWVAIVSAVSWGFVVWAAFKTGFAGSLSLRPMIESAVVPIAAALWYVGIYLYRRRQGVNLGRLFHEIPPE